MNKAIFLDRDGTINVEKNYLYRIEDFEFLPGVIEGLRILQEKGFVLIIITNQSGIARGYYSVEDYKNLNNWMLKNLKEQGVYITDVYYCPHLPNATVPEFRLDCNCRKPKLGLFEKAAIDYNIDISRSYAIGDKLRDLSICNNSDCHGFLIGNNESVSIIESVKSDQIKNISYENSLLSCALRISNNRGDEIY